MTKEELKVIETLTRQGFEIKGDKMMFARGSISNYIKAEIYLFRTANHEITNEKYYMAHYESLKEAGGVFDHHIEKTIYIAESQLAECLTILCEC